MLSDISRQEVIDMSTVGGLTPAEIADQTTMSLPSVYRVLREAGVEPNKSKPGRELTVEQIRNVVADYTSRPDKSVTAILVEYKLTYGQLYKLLQDKGIPLRSANNELQAQRQAQLEAALSMYGAGVPISKIQMATGISAFKLYGELHRRGVPMRSIAGASAAPVQTARDVVDYVRRNRNAVSKDE